MKFFQWKKSEVLESIWKNHEERMALLSEKISWQMEKVEWQMKQLERKLEGIYDPRDDSLGKEETFNEKLEFIEDFTEKFQDLFQGFSLKLEELEKQREDFKEERELYEGMLAHHLKEIERQNISLGQQVQGLVENIERLENKESTLKSEVASISSHTSAIEDQNQKILRFFFKYGQDMERGFQGVDSQLKNLKEWQISYDEEKRGKAKVERDIGKYRNDLILLVDGIDHLLAKLDGEDSKSWGRLLKQWNQQLLETLRDMGATEMNLLGSTFSPKLAESVETTPPSSKDHVPYEVVEVIKRGFIFDDGSLLRKAQVITVEEEVLKVEEEEKRTGTGLFLVNKEGQEVSLKEKRQEFRVRIEEEKSEASPLKEGEKERGEEAFLVEESKEEKDEEISYKKEGVFGECKEEVDGAKALELRGGRFLPVEVLEEREVSLASDEKEEVQESQKEEEGLERERGLQEEDKEVSLTSEEKEEVLEEKEKEEKEKNEDLYLDGDVPTIDHRSWWS